MSRKLKLFLLILLVALAPACVKPRMVKPIFATDDFDSRNIDTITVLPVYDARKDKSASLDANKVLKAQTQRSLVKLRKYEVNFAEDYGVDVEEEDIVSADPEWVKKLGPADSRFLLLVMLEDLQSRFTFGSMGSSEVSGWIFDKQDGSTVWKHKGVGKAGQGGLIGMAMKASMASSAFSISVNNLFGALPIKGEPISGPAEKTAKKEDEEQ